MSFQGLVDHNGQPSTGLDQPLIQPQTATQGFPTTTIYPSQTFTSESPNLYNTGEFLPNDNNSDYVVFTNPTTQPSSLLPFKDPRVLLGFVYLAGIYWELKALWKIQFNHEIHDLLMIFAWLGLGVVTLMSLYSIAILVKVLNINSYITQYPTKTPILIPSRHRSAQSLRKSIPSGAMILSFVTIFVLGDRLIRMKNNRWDWEDEVFRGNFRLIIGLMTNHLVAFIIACFATMMEFKSAWEWTRFYNTLVQPGLRAVYTDNPPNGNNYAVRVDNAIMNDYSSQAYVAVSFSNYSSRTNGNGGYNDSNGHNGTGYLAQNVQKIMPVHHKNDGNNNNNNNNNHNNVNNHSSTSIPKLQESNSHLSEATAPYEGYISLNDNHSVGELNTTASLNNTTNINNNSQNRNVSLNNNNSHHKNISPNNNHHRAHQNKRIVQPKQHIKATQPHLPRNNSSFDHGYM